MASSYTVKLTQSFIRDLEKLHRKDQETILRAVKGLENEPFGPAPRMKKLKGVGIGQWRLRIGVYRARYDVVGREVVLYRVRHRKEIYQD